MPDTLPPATSQSRTHRGHRIRATELGGEWVGTIHAPAGAIVGSVEGASAQEVMVRGVEAINRLLVPTPATASYSRRP